MVSKWLSERLPRDACLLVSPSASFVISMSSSLAQFTILSLLPVGECGIEQPAFALALLESVPFIVPVGCIKSLLMLPSKLWHFSSLSLTEGFVPQTHMLSNFMTSLFCCDVFSVFNALLGFWNFFCKQQLGQYQILRIGSDTCKHE